MKSTDLFSFPTWFAKGIKSGMAFGALWVLFLGPAAQAQTFSVPPQRDPRYNAFLNPNNDPDINPKFNPELNPQFNSRLNPVFNSQINPVFNTAINPQFVTELNPLFNKELDPRYNPDLNPMYRVDGVVYNLEAKPAAYLCVAWPERVMVEFNQQLEFTGYWIANGAGGFNFFDTGGDFKNVTMWPNGKGGFNVFDAEEGYVAFVW